jgi:hypothetical protein
VALGIVSFIVPQLLSPPSRIYEAPLFPLVRAAVEEMQLLTVAFLLASGLILGALFHRRASPICAAAMVLWLPMVSITDMLIDATSHNLFPFEFGMYAILSLVPIFGSWAGMVVRRAFLPRRAGPT